MRKKLDPAVELAARTIQSEPWDISHWWVPVVFGVVAVKHECCFRNWSEPYPGTLGDRTDFICGECSQRGPIERVPSLHTGAAGTREAFDLGFCPLDPFCNGKRLKLVSCASAFAGEVNRFCDSLEKVLQPDDRGMISWEKAHEAYWAFTHFKKHLPDWDPTGAYGGAFERFEADCAGQGFTPWGPEGLPEAVPLADCIALEREEAVTGARRAYEDIIAPAELALDQALADAARVRDGRMQAVRDNPEEEIRRWRREHGDAKVPEVEKFKRRLRALQEESNREYRAKHPVAPLRDDGPKRKAAVDAWKPDAEQLKQAGIIGDLSIAIRCDYEKAWARAIGAYEKAAARAERAYARLMTAPPPRQAEAAKEQADWDTLARLADRLTQLDKLVDQAIGRFATFDVTQHRDVITRQKEEVKREHGLPKVPPPPQPPLGPQHPAWAAWVKAEHAKGRTAKEIHSRLKTAAAKAGTKYPSISTVYRWIGPKRP